MCVCVRGRVCEFERESVCVCLSVCLNVCVCVFEHVCACANLSACVWKAKWFRIRLVFTAV